MRIHFLGTSAGVPTLRRGLPSVAVEREGELLLFDCGEGTQLALQRSEVKAYRIAAVFISHMHGDHVMGLPGLLMSLQMAGRTEPLHIVGPPGLREFIAAVLRLVHARLAYEIDVEERTEPGIAHAAEEYEVVADRLDHRVPTLGFALWEFDRPGRFDLETAESLGVPRGPLYGKLQRGEAVTLEDGRVVRPDQVLGPARRGRRVAYVTDTRPCPAAQRLAGNADLLIHEATFDADRGEEAAAKGHSTVSDAVKAAQAGGARWLALTHISPRYETSDFLKNQARRLFPQTVIAEDGMVLTMDYSGELTSVTGERRRGRREEKPPFPSADEDAPSASS